jgi:ankyrin repeat protein
MKFKVTENMELLVIPETVDEKSFVAMFKTSDAASPMAAVKETDTAPKTYEYSDFMSAIINNDLKTIKDIVKSGMDVNGRNGKGETPLFQAVDKNKIEAARLLLKYPETDINAVDKLGWTVLHNAVYWDRPELVELLLKHPKINLKLKDREERNVMDLASAHLCRESLKLLAKYAEGKRRRKAK